MHHRHKRSVLTPPQIDFPVQNTDELLIKNDTQLARKFFVTFPLHLNTKQLNTNAFHPRTTGQVERCNKTVVTRLRQNFTDHQRDWNIFVQSLTNACNTQVKQSTTSIGLVFSCRPLGRWKIDGMPAFSSDTYNSRKFRALKVHLLVHVNALLQKPTKDSPQHSVDTCKTVTRTLEKLSHFH